MIRSGRDRVGESIDGKLTVLDRLGVGGMGAVYRALQHSMEREVAVKVLRAEISEDMGAVQRFLREAKDASRLNHPGIITLFDFGQAESGELYLVMELLEGTPLDQVMTDRGPWEAPEAISVITEICDALQHAHDKGMIHRDLKPENIFLVGERETVKVIDFGLAKSIGDQGESTVTRTGVVCGTPAYMSPEQVLLKDLDGRSDVYSIAVILYEMLAGERPFAAASPLQMCMAHVQEAPPAIRQPHRDIRVPEAVEAVLLKALAKDPEERHLSPKDFARALRAGLRMAALSPGERSLRPLDSRLGFSVEDLEVTDPGDDFSETRTLMLGRKSGWTWGMAGVLIVAGSLVGWKLVSPEGEDRDPHAMGPAEATAGDSLNATTGKGAAVVTPTTPEPEPSPSRRGPAARDVNAPSKATPEPGAEGSPLAAVVSRVVVVSTPPGAEVYAGDVLRGVTPLEMTRPSVGELLQLELRLQGHRALKIALDSTGTEELQVTLKKRKRTNRKRPPRKGSTQKYIVE